MVAALKGLSSAAMLMLVLAASLPDFGASHQQSRGRHHRCRHKNKSSHQQPEVELMPEQPHPHQVVPLLPHPQTYLAQPQPTDPQPEPAQSESVIPILSDLQPEPDLQPVPVLPAQPLPLPQQEPAQAQPLPFPQPELTQPEPAQPEPQTVQAQPMPAEPPPHPHPEPAHAQPLPLPQPEATQIEPAQPEPQTGQAQPQPQHPVVVALPQQEPVQSQPMPYPEPTHAQPQPAQPEPPQPEPAQPDPQPVQAQPQQPVAVAQPYPRSEPVQSQPMPAQSPPLPVDVKPGVPIAKLTQPNVSSADIEAPQHDFRPEPAQPVQAQPQQPMVVAPSQQPVVVAPPHPHPEPVQSAPMPAQPPPPPPLSPHPQPEPVQSPQMPAQPPSPPPPPPPPPPVLAEIKPGVPIAKPTHPNVSSADIEAHQHDFKPGHWKHAHATFYTGDSTSFGGACGYSDVARKGYGEGTAALSTTLFHDGQACGACFEIKCIDNPKWCKPGQPSLYITATNFCPPDFSEDTNQGGWCNPPREHFDIAYPAFKHIAEYKVGIIPVAYRRVSCKKKGGIKFTITGHKHFTLVSIWNVGGAGDISQVDVKGDSKLNWTPLTRNWGAKWQTICSLEDESLTFKVTTSDGRSVISHNVTPNKYWKYGQTFEGLNFR